MVTRFDRYASLVFAAVGLAFVIGSRGLASAAYGSVVGPGVFPLGLGILLILLSLRLFVETLRGSGKEGEKKPVAWKRFAVLFAAALLYALLLETLGYVISTFLFLLVGFQTMERGERVKSGVIAAVFSVGVWWLFSVILKGTLPGWPAGWGG